MFLRAYDAAGEKVGSNECEEGKIYIEPQASVFLLKSVSKKDWQKKP